MAFNHSLMRGLKEGQPFMLMEQTPSQQNWQPYNALKRPGVMRLWSYQAVAHGADTVMYFQWRRSRGACEKYHGGVVEHAGTSEARVFREVAALGKELESLGSQTTGGRVPAKAAVLFDWNNWWAIEYSSGPSVDLKYVPQCRSYFTALFTLGIPTDILSPEMDLSDYSVVIAPVLYMVKPGVAERLTAFVEAGGTLLTTYFSGIADETDLVYPGGYPGPLRKLLGIWAEEIDVLSPQESNRVEFKERFGDLAGSYSCGTLCDRVHPEGARVLARYAEDFYAGEPALTVNRVGKGRAYYLATVLEKDALLGIVRQLCVEAGLQPPLGIQPPSGVEVMPRVSPGGVTLLYVLNHNSFAEHLRLPGGAYRDLLSGKQLKEEAELPPYTVLILKAAG
jgi:beta-galactosidase